MLSGIRLIASAAARSVRAGAGCTPRSPANSVGKQNLIGFIRCLSTTKDDPGRKIRMRYADLVKALQIGPVMKGIEVDVPNSHHDCYLETNQFTMRYLTLQQPWFDGNVSLNWIITPDTVDKTAVLLSNYVTQSANEITSFPVGKKYMETSTQLISGDGYNLQVLGYGYRFYFELAPGSQTDVAIFTYLNEDPPADKYYLQPEVGENKLIVKTGAPQYIFGVVEPQPLPTITA